MASHSEDPLAEAAPGDEAVLAAREAAAEDGGGLEAVPTPGLAAGVAPHAARRATAVPANPCKQCRRVIAITVPPGGSIRRLYPWGDTNHVPVGTRAGGILA